MPVQARSRDALAGLDQAVMSLVSMTGDPDAEAGAAAAADDDLLLAEIFRADLALYATSAEGVAEADRRLSALEARIEDAPPRECLHFAAAQAWAAGHWDLAATRLEESLLRFPRDLLALRVAQDLYYFLGDARDLRDVAARVIGAWPRERPGWSWVQGIYAFGLEESGDYRRAEAAARDALAENPRDIWTNHALAHVLEMEGRPEEGLAMLDHTVDDWQGSFFAHHNWVHKALYHIDLGDLETLLPLYDGQIRGDRAVNSTALVDAAAVLWRLMLFGVDVSDRATALVGAADSLLQKPVYVFNDWHGLMVFVLADRQDLVGRLIAANRDAPPGTTNRAAIDQAGLAILEGFAAFGQGDHRRAVDTLIPARPHASVLGGSHAQRDLIDLTLLAAAAACQDDDLVRALLSERVERRSSSRAAAQALIEVNRACERWKDRLAS